MTPFIDPLARDDIKPVQIEEYETIATAGPIRSLLTTEEHLIPVLDSITSERHLKSLLGLKGGLENDPYNKDEKVLFRKFADSLRMVLNTTNNGLDAS